MSIKQVTEISNGTWLLTSIYQTVKYVTYSIYHVIAITMFLLGFSVTSSVTYDGLQAKSVPTFQSVNLRG